MSTNATIKLDLDTTGAKGSLDALDRRISQSARAAQSGMGGGGLLGQILGMGAGGLSMTALAGMAVTPIARDAANVAQGIAGSIGNMFSHWTGIGGASNATDAARSAQQQTIAALGPAAAHMSEGQIREVFDGLNKFAQQMAAGKTAVEGATNLPVAAQATEALIKAFDAMGDKIVKAVQSAPRMSTGGSGAMPGAGR